MGLPTIGSVVVVPFPFTDLSKSKLRPAVVLADVEKEDWLLCQITSKSYSDAKAIEMTKDDFTTGALRVTSYARPGKLFTANVSLIVSEEGILTNSKFSTILQSVIALLEASLPIETEGEEEQEEK